MPTKSPLNPGASVEVQFEAEHSNLSPALLMVGHEMDDPPDPRSKTVSPEATEVVSTETHPRSTLNIRVRFDGDSDNGTLTVTVDGKTTDTEKIPNEEWGEDPEWRYPVRPER
jgi:hypothetical protein